MSLRQPMRRITSAMAVAVMMFYAGAAAGQGTSSVWGRVSSADGRPLANVRVELKSPDLTGHRETVSSSTGAFIFSYLPAGDYVITFEQKGAVTVKRLAHVSPMAAVLVDVTMAAASAETDAIVVIVEPRSYPQWPGLGETYSQELLDRLPLEGGFDSARSLAAGPLGVSPGAALVTIDGAPARIGQRLVSPSPLDPGVVAIQETTFATSALPSDAGRLMSGVMAVVTRPGGDRFNGEIRGGLSGAAMDGDVAAQAVAAEGSRRHLEYRAGGPIAGRTTWVFGSGRNTASDFLSNGRLTSQAFRSSLGDRLWHVKGTHAFDASHRVEAMAMAGSRSLEDAPPRNTPVEDPAALGDRVESHRLASVTYAGLIDRDLQLTATFSGERAMIDPRGSDAAALVARTSIRDAQSGGAILAPGTCSSCSAESWRQSTWRVRASRLVEWHGTHQVSAGYEGSLGRIDPPGTLPVGSFELQASRFAVDVENGVVIPVFENNGSSLITWRPSRENRLTFGADGFFVGDTWRWRPRLTVQGGLRWDRHRLSSEAASERVLTESRLSPRVQASWQLFEDRSWMLVGGHARYAADLLMELDPRVTGPAERTYRYQGPAINADAQQFGAQGVANQVLQWFFVNGGTLRQPVSVVEPAVTLRRGELGTSPSVSEWTAGVGHIFGGVRTRVDVLWRRFDGAREWRVDPAGSVVDSLGMAVDRADVVDAGALTRRYRALAAQVDYDLGVRASVGAGHTVSRSWGTYDPSARDGERNAPALAYPEYADPAWAAPEGNLSDDRRHRLKLWAHIDLLASESSGVLRLDLLQTFETGRPLAVVGPVDTSPFAANPGYLQPPIAVPYYFTARDARRTKPSNRTDAAVSYARVIPGTVRTEWMVDVQVLNIFDKHRPLNPQRIARTAFTEPGSFAPFNPFVEIPVEGIHWTVDDRFAGEVGDAGMTVGRTYRVSAGIRF